MRTKFIVVTGGVVSSIGKGLAAASLTALLEARGLRVTLQKLDPYINVDPGTMSPLQHGEVFVTDDGAETDLDLGHYERFSNCRLSHTSNYTSGQIYYSVIEKERRGDYLGGTVQVVPHVTDEIVARIMENAEGNDVAVIEIGGTIGDIESQPFLEAVRQLHHREGHENVMYLHLTLLPYIKAAGELKTKPTQHSVKELQRAGIQPDVILCRCEKEISESAKRKIAQFCNIDPGAVISAPDCDTIYGVPTALASEGLDQLVVDRLHMWTREPDLTPWETVCRVIRTPRNRTVRIGLVGKYVDLAESYKSVAEALTHGAIANDCGIEIVWVDAESIEQDGAEAHLSSVDGIIVPGGFGNRGTEGKIAAITFARTTGVPFFGICLGMQMAVVEFARNVAGIAGANSQEFDEGNQTQVIHLLAGQAGLSRKGGTMRLGAYPCELAAGTLAHRMYGVTQISERHRHRFEFNDDFKDVLVDAGLTISGRHPETGLVEVVEIDGHPWFLGCQYHPEFKSKPHMPHPLFAGFISASLCRKP